MRVPAPDGPVTVLPEGSSLRGFNLALFEATPEEVRYRATLEQQLCLLREAPLAQSARLRWEHSLLQRCQHPLLPELRDSFEHQEHFYLVTSFPQGMRMNSKMAVKGLVETTWLDWAQSLFGLLKHLAGQEVHLDLLPECLVKTQGGQLRLLDLRQTRRSAGHPEAQPGASPIDGRSAQIGANAWKRDLIGLGQCLKEWLSGLTTPTAQANQLVEELLTGGEQSASRLFAPAAVSDEATPGRVPLEHGSRLTCLAPGSRLAGYEVNYHARGGMSLCYLGRLGNEVRFLKEVKADGGESAQALRREFEIMKALKHPHIVRAHQMFELGGYLYLVLDYIEGSSLVGLTKADAEPPPEERLLEWALQLCEALHYLHNQKPPLVYRDLKPANVVLSGECLFLIDFGLARTYKVGQAQDTQALGTFSTASPEHFSGQTDARSDIYSLGATLYLLANPGFKPTAPFNFPPLRKARSAYSENFEKLVHKCLTHSAEGRWPNARALGAELGKLLEPYRKNRKTESSGPDLYDVRFVPNLSSHVASQARELANLVGEGAGLAQALEKLASQCGIPALARIWESVAAQVGKGQTFTAACQPYPRVFSAAYLKQVGHGDKASLVRGAEILEKEDLARCTRSAPGANTHPLGDTGPVGRTERRLALGALVVLALGSGAVVGYSLSDLRLNGILAGGGVAVAVAVVAVFVSAIRDARLLRLQGKARNLVEDAWTSHALGETEKAEQELSKALLLARDKLGPNHLTTLASLHSLANLCRQKRSFDKAAAYYAQAEQIYNRTLPTNHPARAHLHYHWALNFEGQKNIPQALDHLGQSVAIWNKHSGQHPLELAEVIFNEGRIYFDQEEFDKASDRFSQSLELQYGKLGLKSPLVHQSMSYLTRSFVKLRLFKESEPHLASLLVEVEQDLDPNYAALAEANLDMGLIRLEQQRTLEAEPYFLRALQILQHYVGPNERLLKRALDGYCGIFGPLPDQQAGAVQLVSVFMGEREKIRQTMEKHPEWINARDNTGWGPIQWATFMGRDDIVRWLLERGADPGYDASYVMGPLHVACAWDRTEAMLTLLEHDPDVNAAGPGGWTPVFWCSLTGRVRLLESLLKRSANVRCLDDNGRTPLHVAASKNHLKVVASLIGAGADVNAREPGSGSTALHHAAQRGHLAVCDCLIFNGAQLSIKDGAGQTPLELAVKNQHKLLARALRQHSHEGLPAKG